MKHYIKQTTNKKILGRIIPKCINKFTLFCIRVDIACNMHNNWDIIKTNIKWVMWIILSIVVFEQFINCPFAIVVFCEF